MDPSLVLEQELQPIFDELLQSLLAHEKHADVDLLKRAYKIACKAHHDQIRKSGEPYLMHPLRVANSIAQLGLGAESVAAGIMHDSMEDSELSIFDIRESFGREVAHLVDGVTKLGKVPYLSRKEQQAESFRKMVGLRSDQGR